MGPPAPRPSWAGVDGPPPDVQILRDEVEVRFDEAGARRTERRVQVRLLAKAGIDRWSKIGVIWSPARSSRPELTARIVAPSGAVRVISAGDNVDEPMPEGIGGVVRRYTSATLPELGVGSIVEERLVLEDHPSPLVGADAGRFLIGLDGPVEWARFSVSSPAQRPVRIWAVGSGLLTQSRTAGGRTLTITEGGPFPAVETLPPLAPEPSGPAVGVYYSSAGSWAILAQAYHQKVEAALADAPALAAAEGPGDRARAVDAALLVVNRTVRWVRTPLDLEAQTPRRVAEILGNGQGDAQDRALVMIAALRHLGVSAQLALVGRASPEEGPHPEVPELGAFDRVVVAVPGPEGYDYYDPTRFARHLPEALQGRAVLVLAPTTTGLSKTPRAQLGDNQYFERRRVSMAEFGPVDVAETSSATGAMQDRLSAQFEDTSEPEFEALLEGYVRSSYGARSLGAFERREPRRPGAPFELYVEAKRAAIGFTGTKEAELQLRNAVLYTGLPSFLRDAALAGLPGAGPQDRESAAWALEQRRADVVLREPYRAEVQVEVELPDGFVPRALPESRALRLGPAHYEQRFWQGRDARLWVRFRFDTGQARYTAAEARALVQGLRDLWTGGRISLELEHRGAAALAAGRTKQGLQEYQALAEAHPGSAVHRARLAEALLESGLGEAARFEAQAATELDPESGLAPYTLGWVLSHDLYGRQYHRGYDRSGGVAAFLRVLALEPRNREARLSLALLYEHDAEGRRYLDPAGLELAIAQYEQLHAEGAEVAESLLEAHFWAGHYDAVRVLAPTLPKSTQVRTLYLAALLLLDQGAELETALAEESDQGATIQAVGSVLVRLGRYPEALAWAERSPPGPATSGRRALLERVSGPMDPVPTAAAPVEALLKGVLADYPQPKALVALYGKGTAPLAEREVPALVREVKRALEERGGAQIARTLYRDLSYGRRSYLVEGDRDRGYLVRLVGSGAPRWAGRAWLVVEREGALVLAASSSAPFSFGLEAQRRLDQKQWAGARAVLDWARSLYVDEQAAVARFGLLWPRGRPGEAEPMRVAAAALLATGPTAAQAIKALARHADDPVTAEVLVAAYRAAGQARPVLALADRRLANTPEDAAARAWRSGALMQLGRSDQARADAEARRSARPHDLAALETLAQLDMSEGRFAEAQAWLQQIEAQSPDNPNVLNNLAWLSLLRGDAGDSVLAWALAANRATEFTQAAELHTLAAIYAERGQSTEALRLAARRFDLLNSPEPEPADWYLVGRVLEGYGLVEAALRAYGHADRGAPRPDSADRLAAGRRARLLAAGAVESP